MSDSGISNINLIGFFFTLIMGVMMLLLPRRFAVLPLLMTACYITLGQVMSIASLHFTMMRIIILFGCIRVILRREAASIRLHKIDKIFVAYVFVSVSAYILLRQDSEAVISQLGFAYNALGLYFIFRALIRDMDDVYRIFRMVAFIMVPLALAMLLEKATGRNLFSIFGGVPEITAVRDGKLRCQGAFAHPILAGTFGATSLPFFIALWFKGKGWKLSALVGIVAATIITITPASSGPAMAYVASILGLCMWQFRGYMRAVRWSILISLISLHIIMKAPVWALIGKVGGIIGGTGWHRVALIDAAIDHFNEWWLFGTDYTRHWMPTGVTWSDKHTDITNQFIRVGIDGGFISLVIFVCLIVYCFKNVGTKLRQLADTDFALQFTIWSLGVSLFAHITSFISVRYFDQIIVVWYLLLAMISVPSLKTASPQKHALFARNCIAVNKNTTSQRVIQ